MEALMPLVKQLVGLAHIGKVFLATPELRRHLSISAVSELFRITLATEELLALLDVHEDTGPPEDEGK